MALPRDDGVAPGGAAPKWANQRRSVLMRRSALYPSRGGRDAATYASQPSGAS